MLSWRERNITTRTLPQVSVGPFLCCHEIEGDEDGEGDHGYGQEADVGGDPGGVGGGGDAVEGRDGALGHLLPTLASLQVQTTAWRTPGLAPADTGALGVVPLSQWVLGTLVLGLPLTGGTLALAVPLTPHLVSSTVPRTLLTTAPARSLVLLQLDLTANLANIANI